MPSFITLCLDCGYHVQGNPGTIDYAHICEEDANKLNGFGEVLKLTATAMTKNSSASALVPKPPPPPPVSIPLQTSHFNSPMYLEELKQVLE